VEDCVLGLDALYEHRFMIDGHERRVYRIRESDHLPNRRDPFVLVASRIKLPPFSACVMESGGNGAKLPPDTSLYLERNPHLPTGICVDPFLSSKNLDAFRRIIPGIGEELRDELCTLLIEHQYSFAFETSDLGNTELVKHTIDTQGQGPIRQRAYRFSPRQRETAQEIIDELLRFKIIQPSLSPWSASIVLVKKKTGDVRLCVDYRKLNAITKKDSFPLPRIDDVLDMLDGQKFFSTIDLASGYWQIKMDDNSKEKTAFIVDNNVYEWNRLAFVLRTPQVPSSA
jgi:hypothetical protein